MVKGHVPSCPVSREWQGECTEYIAMPANEADEALLGAHGFKQTPSYWTEKSIMKEAQELRILITVSLAKASRPAQSDNVKGSRAVSRLHLLHPYSFCDGQRRDEQS